MIVANKSIFDINENANPNFDGNEAIDRANSVNVIDLCCGLGGISLAASQMGFSILAGVDIDKNALKTFSKNFNGAVAFEGSVRSSLILEKCNALVNEKPKSSLVIVSGPPCQGFSMAGSRDPKDKRNKVLIGVAHAIAKLKPKCALIENVSMVLAEKYESRVERFEKILNDAGYHIVRIILDACDFGIPQKRRRTFFLISKRKLIRESILLKIERFKRPMVGASEVLRDLPTPAPRPNSYSDEMASDGLFNHFAMQHSKSVIEKIRNILPGTGPMSYRKLHPLKPSNTLFSGHRAPPAHYSEPRSITVREAARLQGFPDNFRIYGSFSNQMNQVTNAVPPPLASIVLRVLVDEAEVTKQ